MQLIRYIILSSVFLSLFYLIYLLIFRKENHFRTSRLYLMGSVILSLALPFNQARLELPGPVNQLPVPQLITTGSMTAEALSIEPANPSIDWSVIAVGLYGTITLLMVGRLFMQLFILADNYKKSDKITRNNKVILMNHRFKNHFSFFGWIFVTRNSVSEEELDQIIAHESIHASQYHTVDLIMMELLSAVMWFNPLVWMMKNTVQLVHEYLADEGALSTGIDKLRYQALLINQVMEERVICLSSSFNHSIIKKRMHMMSNYKITRSSKLKLLALIPLSLLFIPATALVNGMFPGSSPEGPIKAGLSLSLSDMSEIPSALQDTIKKTKIIKVITRENPGDTVITETVTVIVSGDTTKTVTVTTGNKTEKQLDGNTMIFISDDEDIEAHADSGMKRTVGVTIKHSDMPEDQNKQVFIITKSEDTSWETGDVPSNTLVIIDGVAHTEQNALSGIDTDSIESISVYKDKSSIRKYTDKDYEGVIIIVTKGGKE